MCPAMAWPGGSARCARGPTQAGPGGPSSRTRGKAKLDLLAVMGAGAVVDYSEPDWPGQGAPA